MENIQTGQRWIKNKCKNFKACIWGYWHYFIARVTPASAAAPHIYGLIYKSALRREEKEI